MEHTFVEDDVVSDFEVVVHHIAEVLSVDKLLVTSHLLKLLQKALHFVTVVNCENNLHIRDTLAARIWTYEVNHCIQLLFSQLMRTINLQWVVWARSDIISCLSSLSLG